MSSIEVQFSQSTSCLSPVDMCLFVCLQDNPEPHDAEQWSEQEVVDWLFTLTRPGSRGGGVTGGVTWKDTDGPGYLAQYATLFERHHITGKSLFLLTSDDLMQMGVLSTGHRKELLEELENMRRNNYRLLHFPPLQQQVREKREAGHGEKGRRSLEGGERVRRLGWRVIIGAKVKRNARNLV